MIFRASNGLAPLKVLSDLDVCPYRGRAEEGRKTMRWPLHVFIDTRKFGAEVKPVVFVLGALERDSPCVSVHDSRGKE